MLSPLISLISCLIFILGLGNLYADGTPPVVVSTSPENGSTGVDLSTPIRITFSEPIDPASVDVSSLRVGPAVPGSYTVEGAVVTFTPSQQLRSVTEYRVFAAPSERFTVIRDLEGDLLAEEFRATFTTRDRSWRAPIRLEDRERSARHPASTIDPQGNIMVVWAHQQATGSGYDLLWNRYSKGAGSWSGAEPLEAVSETVITPKVGADQNGNVFAVWLQADPGGSNMSLYSRRYQPATGWGTPTLLESGTALATDVDLAVAKTGHAIVAWRQAGKIYQRLFLPVGGWRPATSISATRTAVQLPRVAIADGGATALCLWQQRVGSTWHLFGRRMSRAGISLSWSSASRIDIDTGNALEHQLVYHANGYYDVVWQQALNIYERRFNIIGSSWEAIQAFEGGDGSAWGPSLAALQAQSDPVSNIVWVQGTDLYANLYNIEGSTGSPPSTEFLTLLDDQDLPITRPFVAMDRYNNVLAVWGHYEGVDSDYSNLYANYFRGTGSWGGAALIESLPSGEMEVSSLAMNPDGMAVVIFTLEGNLHSVVFE